MDTPSYYTATITSKKQITPHVYEFSFSLVSGEVRYRAGQYASFIIDEKTRRQYSFCCSQTDSTKFDIVVDVAPMGPGSKFFLKKKVGDTVHILAPLGTFFLTDSPRKKIFVATGTGIAPFRAIVEKYLTNGGKETVRLYWGLRFEEDIFWKELFEKWQMAYSNFFCTILLSKPTSAWNGLQGHVTEHVLQEKDLEQNDFYLCGKREMVREIKDQLLTRNVPQEQIKTELF